MANNGVEQKSRKIPSFNWEWNVLLAIIEILPQNKFSSTIQQHVIAKCSKTGWLYIFERFWTTTIASKWGQNDSKCPFKTHWQ